jgi:acetyl esterase/lipase
MEQSGERVGQKRLMREQRICVVIPTYNNGGTIEQVVRDTLAQCDDVIVVNDGSTDATTDILHRIDGITLVEYAQNRGKGYALRRGFAQAMNMGFDYAITLDADGQHYADDIPIFLRAHKEHPNALIVGQRDLKGVQRSSGSEFANKFSNFWFYVQTGQRLADTQTGYRLYPLRRLKGLSWLTSRYEAELELMVLASWHGVQLVSTPIRVYYPPQDQRVSHFRPVKDFLRITVLNTVLCLLALVYALPLRLMRCAKHHAQCAMVGFLLLGSCLPLVASAVNIWEGEPGHKRVELTPYTLPGTGHVAVIVCPGGSYFWHDIEVEGHEVARWLQQNGIAAFVLKYRAAGVPAFITHYRLLWRGNRYPDPQDDLRQALNYVRAHADEYGINPDSIGAMGFSAGGHLVMSAAELFPQAERPAFVAPIYPVVTMVDSCVHKRSRRGLLGDSRTSNKALRDSLSLERHVPKDCPPVFLVNCLDDPVVHWRNAALLDSALTANDIPHIYLQYRTGGHGFGASENRGTSECRQWKQQFLEWIK